MRLLLDSHALHWAVLEPHKLRPEAADAISDPANAVWFSAVNLWELAIKRAKGKIRFDDEVMLDAIDQQRFVELPITTRHGLEAASLPPFHADPFDRLLVGQARLEGLTLVTNDRTLRRYRVLLLEA